MIAVDIVLVLLAVRGVVQSIRLSDVQRKVDVLERRMERISK